MSFSLTNKILSILSCLLFLNACNSTKSIYQNIKTPKYEIPVIEYKEHKKITLNFLEPNKIDHENKIVLQGLKNNSQYQKDIIIKNDKAFALNKDNSILEFDINSGQLISTKTINILDFSKENIVSFKHINNSFIIALKSGSILNIDLSGNIIWEFESNNILNTALSIFDDQIIALYVDEIISISLNDGSLIWSEDYNNLPIYQAKGGQLVNFLNLLFFILPNNSVGSIDLNFGIEHNFVFNEISLIGSINNTEDKIHIFDNYFTYLDEGKYLYTVNILNNDFTLNKKNISSSSSNIFFNNSLILKEGNYLHAININNGKSFWVIDSKDISSKSLIIAIRSIGENIEIFLNNGDVLVIHNKKLIKINNLKIKNIKSVVFDKENIIVNSENGKIVIFK